MDTRRCSSRSQYNVRTEINNPVSVLDDRAYRRACLQAARIFTVHTAVFTNQPFQLAVLFGFAKTHHRPGFRAKIGRVVIHPDAMTHLVTNVIPLGTSHLAGFTAYAGGDVDQFCDFRFIITRLGGGVIGFVADRLMMSCVSKDICSPPLRLLDVN